MRVVRSPQCLYVVVINKFYKLFTILVKIFKHNLVFLLLLVPYIGLAAPITPQQGLDKAKVGTGMIERNPLDITAMIIRALMTLLGALFLVLIITGGFKWMTAGGNTEKVKEARDLIKNSLIGLTIVLASYAIVWFIFENLYKAGQTPAAGDM